MSLQVTKLKLKLHATLQVDDYRPVGYECEVELEGRAGHKGFMNKVDQLYTEMQDQLDEHLKKHVSGLSRWYKGGKLDSPRYEEKKQ